MRIPDALQVGGRPAGAGCADEEVAAVLIVERLESRIDGAGGILAQPPVGRECILWPAAEIERDAAEQRAIVGDVRVAEALEGPSSNAVQTGGGRLNEVGLDLQ